MAESLLSDPNVLEYIKETSPVLDIEPIKNKTKMDVDTASIADSMRTLLMRSRRFRLLDRSTAKADVATMDEQARQLPGSRNASLPGQQLSAQMCLSGSLADIVKSTWKISSPLKKLTDHYYKFSMRLKDLRTGEVVWSDEQEIRKVANLPLWR